VRYNNNNRVGKWGRPMVTMGTGEEKGAFCANVKEGRVALRMDGGLARIGVWERGRLREARELKIRFREGDGYCGDHEVS
jgi:hypothetical protein